MGGGGGGAVRAVKSQCGGAVARWRKRRVGVGSGVLAQPGVRWAVGLTWGGLEVWRRTQTKPNQLKPLRWFV